MIETKDITKAVQHILKRDKGIADTQIMHPTREWFTGLGISLLVVGAGSWSCYYLYSFYSHEVKKEAVIIEQAIPYQAAIVKNALESFSIKQETYNEIINGKDTKIPESNSSATSTPIAIGATTTESIPDVIIDPPPSFDSEETLIEATLAP